jgi:hypothetical protein
MRRCAGRMPGHEYFWQENDADSDWANMRGERTFGSDAREGLVKGFICH